jgi:hypothetical protein
MGKIAYGDFSDVSLVAAGKSVVFAGCSVPAARALLQSERRLELRRREQPGVDGGADVELARA